MSLSLSLVGTVASAVLCLYVAGLALRIGRAPGYAEQRWFGLAALTAGAYAALNVVTSSPAFDPSPRLAAASASVQLAAVALHALGWSRYARGVMRGPGATDRFLEPLLAAGALIALPPGLAFRAELRSVDVPALASRYLVPQATPLASAVLALAALALAATTLRLAGGWRRSVPGSGTPAVALAALVVLLVHDALVSLGYLSSPFVSDLALAGPIAAVGWTLTGRFVNDAHALDALRRGLQTEVEQRTEALRATQETLARTEKLAAVGQFAAGVAHQVSNPLAAIGASLSLLDETRPPGCAESAAAVADAKAALARISTVTRRLRDASRLAATPPRPGAATRLASAVADAVALARAGLGPAARDVPVGVEVPGTLWVAAEEDLVVEVVANLVTNALEATALTGGGPEAGAAPAARVRVTAEAEGERLRLCVEDDGAGMPPDVLAHVFEPFFSTKQDPLATGLGLAVSRGLVASAGGELTLESAVGRGTRAWVELPAGAPEPDRE